jgi:hypothetical protein
MAGLINLPGYAVPNALNFSGLNAGIDSIRENALAQRQMGMQEQQLGMQKERLGMERKGFDQKYRQQQVQQMGALAQAAMAEKDPARRQAIHARILSMHPDGANLDPIYRDPERGVALIAQEAQGFVSDLDRRAKESQIGMQGAHAEYYRAQARQAGTKSSLDENLGRLIGGMIPGGPPAAAPQGGPTMQPQSFGGPSPQGAAPMPVGDPQAAAGGPQQGDPNLILAQAPQQQPQAAPDPSGAADMVQTPMGPMTRQRASQLGFALALGGKGDAGKMLSESAQQGMPGKEARNEIEKKLFAAMEQKSRLQGIRTKFKPEWQTVDEQLKQYGISWVDSIGPLRNKIPPAMRQGHAEYTQYRQEAFTNMNQYIKDMTGAAMSEQEANRLRKGIPDPERDGPTAFEAKTENLMAQSDLASARMNYLLKKGFQGKPWESGVSLERMQGIINDRGRQIEGMIKSSNPNAPPQAIQRETFRIVKQEFGI